MRLLVVERNGENLRRREMDVDFVPVNPDLG